MHHQYTIQQHRTCLEHPTWHVIFQASAVHKSNIETIGFGRDVLKHFTTHTTGICAAFERVKTAM